MEKIIKIAICFCCALLLSAVLPLGTFAQSDDETVECVGITAPYRYSDYGNVSFPVFFDRSITDVNYKHVACSADVLKSMSFWDNPAMTPAIADDLERTGVIDSMNDCIEINGKKVREWQKTSQLACMILVGELGDCAKMNIDFNGAIDEVRIDDLDQRFVITLYRELLFPNGRRLKKTQTFVYDPAVGTFSEKQGSDDMSNAAFSVFYNGTALNETYNIVDVHSSGYSPENLCVYPENSDTVITIEPQFEKMRKGYNYIYITATAPDGVNKTAKQVILNNVYVKPTTKRQIVMRYVKLGAIALLTALCVVLGILLIRRRRVRQ